MVAPSHTLLQISRINVMYARQGDNNNNKSGYKYDAVTCLALWLPILIIAELLLTYFRHLKSYKTNKITLTAQQRKSLVYIVSTMSVYVASMVVVLGFGGAKCLCYAGFDGKKDDVQYSKNLIMGLTLGMLVIVNKVVRDLAVSNVNFQISRYVIESEKGTRPTTTLLPCVLNQKLTPPPQLASEK